MRKKISVIGAGNVGATAAFALAQLELGDIVLLDIAGDISSGKALDMAEAAPILGVDGSIVGTNDYAEVADSDVLVVTAGLARRSGVLRLDLMRENVAIIKEVAERTAGCAPGAILIMVTNPVDVMAYLAWKITGFPSAHVVGQAGVLDAARFRYFIAMELNISVEDIRTMVLGGHGDTMVPLPRYTTVSGIPLTELMPQERIGALIQRTCYGGGEIVKLLAKCPAAGSAFYAPGAAIAQMVEAILKDKKRILPCSAYLTGQYGIKGLFIGVPVRLGAGGVEEIIELRLTDEELSALRASAKRCRESLKQLSSRGDG